MQAQLGIQLGLDENNAVFNHRPSYYRYTSNTGLKFSVTYPWYNDGSRESGSWNGSIGEAVGGGIVRYNRTNVIREVRYGQPIGTCEEIPTLTASYDEGPFSISHPCEGHLIYDIDRGNPTGIVCQCLSVADDGIPYYEYYQFGITTFAQTVTYDNQKWENFDLTFYKHQQPDINAANPVFPYYTVSGSLVLYPTYDYSGIIRGPRIRYFYPFDVHYDGHVDYISGIPPNTGISPIQGPCFYQRQGDAISNGDGSDGVPDVLYIVSNFYSRKEGDYGYEQFTLYDNYNTYGNVNCCCVDCVADKETERIRKGGCDIPIALNASQALQIHNTYPGSALLEVDGEIRELDNYGCTFYDGEYRAYFTPVFDGEAHGQIYVYENSGTGVWRHFYFLYDGIASRKQFDGPRELYLTLIWD